MKLSTVFKINSSSSPKHTRRIKGKEAIFNRETDIGHTIDSAIKELKQFLCQAPDKKNHSVRGIAVQEAIAIIFEEVRNQLSSKQNWNKFPPLTYMQQGLQEKLLNEYTNELLGTDNSPTLIRTYLKKLVVYDINENNDLSQTEIHNLATNFFTAANSDPANNPDNCNKSQFFSQISSVNELKQRIAVLEYQPFIINSDGVKVGNHNDGNYNGIGTIIYPDRSKYIGNIQGGLPHGDGMCEYGEYVAIMDGKIKYQGNFIKGSASGKGIITYANGDTYEGDVNNKEPQGKGILFFTDNTKLESEFDGFNVKGGSLIFPDGSIFKVKANSTPINCFAFDGNGTLTIKDQDYPAKLWLRTYTEITHIVNTESQTSFKSYEDLTKHIVTCTIECNNLYNADIKINLDGEVILIFDNGVTYTGEFKTVERKTLEKTTIQLIQLNGKGTLTITRNKFEEKYEGNFKTEDEAIQFEGTGTFMAKENEFENDIATKPKNKYTVELKGKFITVNQRIQFDDNGNLIEEIKKYTKPNRFPKEEVPKGGFKAKDYNINPDNGL